MKAKAGNVQEGTVILCTVSFSGFRILKRKNAPADLFGGLAQLVERLPCKQEVSGSNPLISTIWVASSAG